MCETVVFGLLFCAECRISSKKAEQLQLILDLRAKKGYNLIDVKDIEQYLFDLTSVLLSPFFCSTHSFFILFFAGHRCPALFLSFFITFSENLNIFVFLLSEQTVPPVCRKDRV